MKIIEEGRKIRRRKSYHNRPRRTKSTCASSPSDDTKLLRNIETAKQNLKQLAEKYIGVNNVDGFLVDLWVALGIQNQGGLKRGGKPSRYAIYQMTDGTMLLISIRASGHNANADKYLTHPPIPDKNLSIVLQKKMRRNQFKSNSNVNLVEFVYINQKIKNVENPLSKIAYSLINYLDTGKYIDQTGVAIQHGGITENKQYKNMRNNTIRLTESQLHRVIKESVKSVLCEVKPGSISHGTMRMEDVLPIMYSTLFKENPRKARQIHNSCIGFLEAMCDKNCGIDNDWWDSEEAHFIYEDLEDALQEYAPEGHYFGTHEGDGSDLGFWPEEDE